MVIQMVNKYVALLADVETAFLDGDSLSGEEFFMEFPLGLPHKEDKCLLLLKSIYSLVQAALTFYCTF